MIPLPLIAPPVFTYAEMHYRFKYFFSYLKKHEPEILADAPHRLEPGADLPILLFVKDAHLYPMTIHSVVAHLRTDDENPGQTIFLISDQQDITEKFWWHVTQIPLKGDFVNYAGPIFVDVEFSYSVKGKKRQCVNDNYRTSSKQSLRVYRSATSLPALPGWIAGDAHTHSWHTEDQVEFGSPTTASVILSKAMGLSFFCVTDHSYDIDDREDNYLVNDPAIPKWIRFQKECNSINAQEKSFAVVRGEEVSCWNDASRNVHLLLYGTRRFFPGSGDSAERWFHTRAELTIPDVLREKNNAVAAYAAHPLENVPLLHRFFFGRGIWGLTDMISAGLNGLQIANGERTSAFEEGLAVWKSLLLKGHRLHIAAGNDAHGNFNRYRQLGIPFFTIADADKQLFGRMRTAVKVADVSEENIVAALLGGNSCITNGPIGVLSRAADTVAVSAISSPEFGTLQRLHVYSGTVGDAEERVLCEFSPAGLCHFSGTVNLHSPLPSYIRLEVATSAGTNCSDGFCYTNPIWISS
jgi:hypothetical protein